MQAEITDDNLKFLLQNGIRSSRWCQATGLLTIVFRQPRVRSIFCGLCCFVDTRTSEGKIRRSERPRWMKDLIASTSDPESLTLDVANSVKGELPASILVFLPKFWSDASSGKTKDSYTVECYEISLQT